MVATPLLALWRHEDARAAVVDFLPTSTIAVLAMIAKPMREAKSCLLLTAIKRRGKTVPTLRRHRACSHIACYAAALLLRNGAGIETGSILSLPALVLL